LVDFSQKQAGEQKKAISNSRKEWMVGGRLLGYGI
jgi:hypothetical protein